MNDSSRRCCLWSFGFGDVVIVCECPSLEIRSGASLAARRSAQEAHLFRHHEASRFVQYFSDFTARSFAQASQVLKRSRRHVEIVVFLFRLLILDRTATSDIRNER